MRVRWLVVREAYSCNIDGTEDEGHDAGQEQGCYRYEDEGATFAIDALGQEWI